MKKDLMGAALMALLCLGTTGAGQAGTIAVTVNTAGLSGTSGRFEFDLFDGDGLANNTVTISNIVTNGTLGAVDCSVGCTPSYVLSDAGGLGILLQDLTLGSSFSFLLNFSNNFGVGSPDQFALFLLNPATNFTLLNTSLDTPFSDALLLVNLDGTARNVQTADTGVSVSAVPEPGYAALLLATLPLLQLRKRLAVRR